MRYDLSGFSSPPEFRKGLTRLGWTQAAFARRIGKWPSTITDAFRRGRMPVPYAAYMALMLEVQDIRDELNEILRAEPK